MTVTACDYPCGPALRCENKGPDGPREAHLCPLCGSYFRSAVVGWNRRKAFDVSVGDQSRPETANAWDAAYAAVDALGAMAEDNHATYMFFRALHFVTCAQYGRSFGATVKHFNGLFEALPSLTSHTAFLESEFKKMRKCRQWCGRKVPEERCKDSCSLAVGYLLDVRRIAGQPGLDRCREIINAFGGMSGLTRCKAITVADDIFGLDPISCAALGQYTRKVIDGLEVSLMVRLDAWIAERARVMAEVNSIHAARAERRQHGHAL